MHDQRITRRDLGKIAIAGIGGSLCQRWVFGDEPQPRPLVAEGDAEPLPFVDGSFTIAALPDTQFYSQTYHQHFYNQTHWIVENRESRDIQFVLHLGDITSRNTAKQWKVAQKALRQLDGVVPYSLALGNHDCGPGGNGTTRDTMLNDYFPVDVARKQKSLGGLFDEKRLDNSFHTFSARGQKFLVLALEWGPRDSVVQWADTVVGQHADHRVILSTHAYMYFDDTRYDWSQWARGQRWNPHSYGIANVPGGINDGQQLWDNLIAKHPGFCMTLNGHVLEDGLGRLTSPRTGGQDVHQMLVNYQMKHEGGEGYLRLIEFLPDGHSVQVKAFSPSTGQYKTDPQNQFVLKLKPAWTA